jgi:hypothetical protein
LGPSFTNQRPTPNAVRKSVTKNTYAAVSISEKNLIGMPQRYKTEVKQQEKIEILIPKI